MVVAAGFGLVDGHPLAVGQVEHLVGQGELADLRMVERLGLPAPVPYVVPLPEAGELGAAVEQFRDQRGDVWVAGCVGGKRAPGPRAAALPTAATSPSPPIPATRNGCGTCPSSRRKGRPHVHEAVLTDGVRAPARESGMSAGT